MRSRVRERRTHGSVRGLRREPLVYSTLIQHHFFNQADIGILFLFVGGQDLLNDPVQPGTHGGIGHTVDLCHFFERTGGKYKAFDKIQIFL